MRRRSKSRQRALLALVAVILAACGRPAEPLDIGIREIANDIVLGGGDEEVTAPAPVPPTAVSVSLPQTTSEQAEPRFDPPPPPPEQRPQDSPTPPPPPPPPPPPEPETCPQADPRDAPKVEAPTDRAIPPVEAAYTYRNDGAFTVSGANANEGEFTAPTTWEVKDVEEADNGDFTYAVEAELGGTTTTTTYRVRNEPTVTDPTGAVAQADPEQGRGLYMIRLESTGPDGDQSSFQPATPLLLLPFPATQADEQDVTGTDPTTGTTMSYHLTVAGKNRVDACGEPLDAVRVELTNGRIVGPNMQVEFAAIYDFGTQYGGLMLRDQFEIAGTEGLNTVSRTNTATINDVPRRRP